MESADHQPVFIEHAEVVLVQGAHDPPDLSRGIVFQVLHRHVTGSRKNVLPALGSAGPDTPEQVKEFGQGVVVETFFAAVLVTAVAGKPIACRGPVIGLPHTPVKVPDPFGKGIYRSGISGLQGREYGHALLQGRVEIISQVAWSSSSL
jgi:hypothetical protein